MNEMNIVDIMRMIPHRYPFLLIDRVIEIKPNASIVGIKNVSYNEPQFTGHFPHRPIMPGVLIIEAMAQLSAVLVSSTIEQRDNKEVYFLAIESTKFRKIVEPGDILMIYSEITQHRSNVWKFIAKAKVKDHIVAESAFTAMIKERTE